MPPAIMASIDAAMIAKHGGIPPKITPHNDPEITSERNAVTGRLKRALDAMVWQGLDRRAAAKYARLTENGLYAALKKPHVKAHYLQQLDVLRTSERARNVHRLAEIRDAANNMPAVQAIRALELIDEEQRQATAGTAQSPGLVIVINAPTPSAAATPQRTIEHGCVEPCVEPAREGQ
jgi:hypothetical protein